MKVLTAIAVLLIFLGASTVGTVWAMPHSQGLPQTAPVISADLSVTKAATPNSLLAGSNVIYTINVTNHGPAGASNVVMTDNLPGGLTFVSATPSQGTCSQASGAVTCNLGNLVIGANAMVNIVVAPTASGVINNTASATATESDPNTANNQASASIMINPADLSVNKNDSPDSVILGNNLTYTIIAKNNGPAAATGVMVTDSLPAGVTFVLATPSQGTCSQASGTVTCNLGSLASSVSATITIIVTPTAAGVITNTANIAASEPDPHMDNNKSTEKTRVRAQAEVNQAKIGFTGSIQSLPSSGLIGAWKIQGLTVNVTQNTEIKDTPQVGSFVKVKGTLNPDGTVQAQEIKVKEPEENRHENKKDGHDRPGLGLGDKNHEHQGAPGLDNKKHHDDHGKSESHSNRGKGKGN